MGIFVIIVLGMVQALTEFLPVSSSGHLVVVYEVFKIRDNTILLSIVLHIATLLAVVIYFRKDLLQLIKNPFCKTNKKLVVSTLATVIIFLIMKNFVESSFNINSVIYAFLVTSLLLFVSEIIGSKRHNVDTNGAMFAKNGVLLSKSDICNINITYSQALFIGAMQGVATVPGISRSGTTISAGLLVGLKKTELAKYSFILSIPIILASLFYELIKAKGQNIVLGFSFIELFIGFIIAFLVGMVCLKIMIEFVKKQKLYYFSIYLILISLFLIVNKHFLFWF